MMPSLDTRERKALLVFFGGVVILFAFFAAGAFVGRWPKGAPALAGAGQRGDAELFLVEVGAFETQDRANESVTQLRRQYTSARAVYDATDRLFHVVVGPYPQGEAGVVADELRQRGVQAPAVKPYTRQ
jgi:cell division septation protein DedD